MKGVTKVPALGSIFCSSIFWWCKQPPPTWRVARQGESCGVLGGVCRNSSAACAERRGFATAPLLCHCEVEKAPVKDSKLQRTQREKEFQVIQFVTFLSLSWRSLNL